jgi:hypothetical protein
MNAQVRGEEVPLLKCVRADLLYELRGYEEREDTNQGMREVLAFHEHRVESWQAVIENIV